MSDDKALVARLLALAPEKRRAALRAAGEAHVKAFDTAWPVWAHDGQLPTSDGWMVWVMLGGRGFGKTKAGAEWVSAKARETPGARIALVAATADEARRVMIEGPAGLFAAARDGPERRRMHWQPSLGRLTFASGAEAFVYSGADGETLRGPEHHFAWCDELAKWKRAQATLDNLLLGLRAGALPQAVITTTPRPVPALKAVLAMPGVVVTGGASRDNPHVAPTFVAAMERIHGGTRLGRQELEGLLLEDEEGALWPRTLIEAARHDRPMARSLLTRVVIGVDPPASAEGDACGIVACGLDGDGIGHVLADHSVAGLSPEGWARKVAAAARSWEASRVVAEKNNGGAMVESVLRAADTGLPVTLVHASDSKGSRAEPVAVLFEGGRARFAGRFPALEDELAGFRYGGGYEAAAGAARSPDRADAMIWAMTELMVKRQAAPPQIRAL